MLRVLPTLGFLILAPAQPASAQTADELRDVRDMALKNVECLIDMRQWETGQRAALIRQYGRFAEDIIIGCSIGNQARESLIADFLERYPDALSRFD